MKRPLNFVLRNRESIPCVIRMATVKTNPPPQFWRMLAGKDILRNLYPTVSLELSPKIEEIKSRGLNFPVIPFSFEDKTNKNVNFGRYF